MHGPAGRVLRVGVSEAIGAAVESPRSGAATMGWRGGALRFAQVPLRGHLLEIEVVLQGVEYGIVNRACPV